MEEEEFVQVTMPKDPERDELEIGIENGLLISPISPISIEHEDEHDDEHEDDDKFSHFQVLDGSDEYELGLENEKTDRIVSIEHYENAVRKGHSAAFQKICDMIYSKKYTVDTFKSLSPTSDHWYKYGLKLKYIGDDSYIDFIKRSANFLNVDAMISLSREYEKSDGKQCYYWANLAVETCENNVNAQVTLGVCYYNGYGVKQDYKKAVQLYTKSIDQRNAMALYHLGLCYKEGNGVEQDNKKAIILFTESANRGYANAQFNLGICYRRGIMGVDKDEKKAKEWTEKSNKQNTE